MSVTMKDIAAKLGISQAIVSLVLNKKDNGRVSSEKRQKILDMATEINYIPNMSAVSLRRKSSKLIGIAGHFITVPVHSIFLWKLSYLLNENGYNTLSIDFTSKTNDEERKGLSDLISRGVDAIILAETFLDESEFSRLPVPILKILPNIKNPDIMIDLQEGAHELVSHLIKVHGHSKIGMLTAARICPFRKQGYVDALTQAGIVPDPAWALITGKTRDPEKKILRMVKNEKVTAFFCNNDFIAANLIKFFTDNNLDVPGDVAVTGFDGLTLATLTQPSITTAIQPMLKLATTVAETILNMIKNNELRYQGKVPVLIKPEIYFGGSCGCVDSKIHSISNFYGLPTIEADKEFERCLSKERK